MTNRPSPPSVALEHAFADLIAVGVPLADACRVLDVEAADVRAWLAAGQRPGPCWRFAAAVKHAQVERAQTLAVVCEQAHERVSRERVSV